MNKNFSFFFKIFFSLFLTILFFLFITRSYSQEKTYKNYFSQVVTNFGKEFKKSIIVRDVINWFNPKVNGNSEDLFIKYKLVVVLKYLDNYFKEILKETQEKILDDHIHNFKNTTVGQNYYKDFKKKLKNYLIKNKDLLEITLYQETGEKIIGIKYKKIAGYQINKNLISRLKKKNNLLFKHQNSSNLILLSLVKYDQKPFLIISQTINQNFFSRILNELEVDNNLFYFKDSNDFVILDNYGSYTYKEKKKESNSYQFYKTFVEAKEVNLSLNLNRVEYSLGVFVNKNNFWGNTLAMIFLMIFFAISFLFLDWMVNKLKVLDRILTFFKIKNVNQLDESKETLSPTSFSSEDLLPQQKINSFSSIENSSVQGKELGSDREKNDFEEKLREQNRSIFLDIKDNN